MSDKLVKTIIGALVAVGLAVAVSYGLISQQTADKLQADTNQTLSDDKSAPGSAPQQLAPQQSAPQQPAPTAPQSPNAQAPASPAPAPSAPAPQPQQPAQRQ